jgi:low affinity Fe/Cu permease
MGCSDVYACADIVNIFTASIHQEKHTLVISLTGGHYMQNKSGIFTRFTTKASTVLGRAWVFALALFFLVSWAASGPIFGFSDTWQLIINTSTTIITFLMVFIIQNTQNRDNMAMNLKLDALMERAHVSEKDLLDAEDMSDKLLEKRLEGMQKRQKKTSSRKSKRK